MKSITKFRGLPDGWESKPRVFSYDVLREKIEARGLSWLWWWGSLGISAMLQSFIINFGIAFQWWVFIPVCSIVGWLAGFIVIRLRLRNHIRRILAK